jgi:hypothetical protein
MRIEFIPASKQAENIIPAPKPAKKYIPDWYKNIKTNDNLNYNAAALKSCMPFLDSLSAGYIQESWSDIYIEKYNDSITYSSNSDLQLIGHRDNVSISLSPAYHQMEFIWKMYWLPKLPRGWSAIVMSPGNRLDLPFTSLTAIIDSDQFYHSHSCGGNYPFYISNEFTGLIPAGTPMYQIIPFKRKKWISSAKNFTKKIESEMQNYKSDQYKGYKKTSWQKKDYS